MTALHSNLQTLFVWIGVFAAGIGIMFALKAGRLVTALLGFLGLCLAAAFVFATTPQIKTLGASTWKIVTAIFSGHIG